MTALLDHLYTDYEKETREERKQQHQPEARYFPSGYNPGYSADHMAFLEGQIEQLDQDIAARIREAGLEPGN